MISNCKPVTHVLFDLDGLLLNTESLYTIGTQNVLDKFFQNPRKLYSWDYKVILMGLKTEEVWKKIVEHFDIPVTWQEYEKLAIEQFDVLMKDCVKLPGADRLINHLNKHNIPFCLATSSSKESFDIKSTHHQEFFSKFNHIVLGSSDSGVTRGKPFPDIFLVAASRFTDQPKPENCLVFEDSPNGVKAARAANMQVVMVPNPHVTEDQRENATKVLNSLLDFKPEEFGLPPFDD
ncbi:probable pseudouridine-5'-phosphatase [Chironomus tepperi]|uniref:probable pseudouridine-5'-phosphatase n=1 Tax=Chironomus tepperi TaxID=113505 RepID=UPI00391FA386